MSRSLLDNHLYTISIIYGGSGGRYEISDCGDKSYYGTSDPVVWSRAMTPEDEACDAPYPDDVRAKYESLLGRGEFEGNDNSINLVELIADQDGCAFDQPCAYGHRVEDHAVYCHNDKWLYAPRKCHRGRQWSGEIWPHEECRGFAANTKLKS